MKCDLKSFCRTFQRFTQYLASSNSTFQLSNFLDKSGVQGECHNQYSYLDYVFILVIKIGMLKIKYQG